MTSTAEILLALFLLTNIVLAGTGRLRQAIRLVAVQGWMVGLLPILLWNWTDAGAPGFRVWAVAFVNGAVKGVALPRRQGRRAADSPALRSGQGKGQLRA